MIFKLRPQLVAITHFAGVIEMIDTVATEKLRDKAPPGNAQRKIAAQVTKAQKRRQAKNKAKKGGS